jgi:hypothetical protein
LNLRAVPTTKFLLHGSVILLLTALTQVGAIAYVAAYLFYRHTRLSWATFAVFFALYTVVVVAANLIAPAFGRVPISCFDTDDAKLAVRSPLFCALNRNFVTLKMRTAALALASNMDKKFSGTKTLILDGNFPFIDGFPLLPHLSHSDGKKLDIAFYYAASGSYLPGRTRSPIGYFAFEQPEKGAELPCADRSDMLTFRWNFNYLQSVFPSYQLDGERTKEALRWLATDGDSYGVEKIFVEPYLAQRLKVKNERIRFQGCRAARHDDHIHFQVR